MNHGYLVSFEGIDGCGKTTQARLFLAHLKKQGLSVLMAKEPGGTVTGERIRRILLSRTLSVSPWCELLLYTASRAQLVFQVVDPAVRKGTIVICDRYVDSTVAYQCFGRGLPERIVAMLHGKMSGYVEPAITFLIDGTPEDCAEILKKKRKDRIEEEAISFQKRVRRGYHRIAEANARVRIVPRRSIPETFATVVAEWESFVHETGRSAGNARSGHPER